MSYDTLRKRVERAEQIVIVPHRAKVDALERIARHLREDPAHNITTIPDADLEALAGCTDAEYNAAVREVEKMGLCDALGRITSEV